MVEVAPTRVGPFRVVRSLAQGGMATVYEVMDPETGRTYAAKVLSDSTGSSSRFIREYAELSRLDHPNVVRVYRFGLTETGAPYLVMELLQGVPAQVRVKSIGRPGDASRTAEAVRIVAHVARALSYLHDHGVVHRDLKSSNVLVLGDGQVKVLDFGTARLLRAVDPLTEPGEFVGTFHYASPEQLTGRAVGTPADLYALGVLAYRLLTGRRAFEGDTPTALARLHLEHVPPAPSRLVPAIPEPVSGLVMRLLEKDPARRPASAAEVADELALPADEPPRRASAVSLRAIGRQAQLRVAQVLLDAPTHGAALVFTGPEGCGRSRLVGQALEEAGQRGMRAVRLTFAGVRRPFADLAAKLLPTFGEVDPPAGAAAAHRLMAMDRADPDDLAALVAARAAADGGWVAVGADDVERGARRDVACLFQAFERLHKVGAPALLFATWSESPVARAWPTAHAVPVPPLTGEEVAVLASHWLGVASVPPALVRRLLAASGGMPGPLEALVRVLPRDPAVDALVVPEAVREDVLLRLGALTPVQRRCAEAVSLADGDLDTAQVGWAVDEHADVALAALDRLAGLRLVAESDGLWSFRMGIAAELVRSRIRPTRRRVLVRRIAEGVLGTPASPRLAAVLEEAGDIAAAAACLVAWAEPLVRAGMHVEALPPLQQLCRSSADPALGRLLAACLVDLRPESDAATAAVIRLLAAAKGPERGEAALVAAKLARARGDADGEAAHLDRATELLGEDPARIAVGRALRADLCRLTGQLSEARDLAEEAAEGADGPEAAMAAAALAEALLELGDLRGAESAADETSRREVAAGQPAMRGAATRAVVLRLQGRFGEARATLDAVLAQARSQAPLPVYARLLLGAARVDMDLFRVGLARERLDELRDASRRGVPPSLEGPLALLRARALRLSGDDEAARALLSDAEAGAVRRGFRLHAAWLCAVRAASSLHERRARVELSQARALLARMGAFPALAEIAALQAERPGEDPDVAFADVAHWMQMQPARPTRLEYLLAAARRATAEGDSSKAQVLRGRADALLAQIRRLLGPEDEDALLVHPWTRR